MEKGTKTELSCGHHIGKERYTKMFYFIYDYFYIKLMSLKQEAITRDKILTNSIH